MADIKTIHKRITTADKLQTSLDSIVELYNVLQIMDLRLKRLESLHLKKLNKLIKKEKEYLKANDKKVS